MKIILSSILVLFLVGCGDEAKKETPFSIAPKESVKSVVIEGTNKPIGIKQPATVATIVPVKEVSAKSLFAKCAGCHGIDASKKALGKSKVIKGWSTFEVTQALQGYKDGTYGGAMKSVMVGQVKSLNAVDISILSEYISKL